MKASEIRRGSVIMYNKTPYRVMDFRHHTPGNLRAMVQTKLRNLLNGSQTEVRFSSTEDIPEADVMTSRATFLYQDGDGYHFMFTDSYEQISMSAEALGDSVYYLKDQMDVDLTTYNSEPIGVQLPATVVLEIVDTEPNMNGATQTSSYKPAKTDTGLSLGVPQFINNGDKIIVRTEDNQYVKRAE